MSAARDFDKIRARYSLRERADKPRRSRRIESACHDKRRIADTAKQWLEIDLGERRARNLEALRISFASASPLWLGLPQ